MKTLIRTLLVSMLLGGVVMAEENWISLFNGKNLDGWIPKVKGSKAGENPGNIFRVEDGLLTVSYDAFDKFENRFGHIFVDRPFTNYRFRCEYRFTGKQSPGGPGWAFRNNGIMIHCQSPESMEVDQSFPDSVEFQFLGQDDSQKRVTGSLFLPGSMVEYKGTDTTKPVKSTRKALPEDVWVKAEAEVHGNGTIRHIINGEVVMEYTKARRKDGTPVGGGYISLQAESHPTQFRNIEILILD